MKCGIVSSSSIAHSSYYTSKITDWGFNAGIKSGIAPPNAAGSATNAKKIFCIDCIRSYSARSSDPGFKT
jgi:hypothetical protein